MENLNFGLKKIEEWTLLGLSKKQQIAIIQEWMSHKINDKNMEALILMKKILEQ